mmetsp:Transcript_5876/g.10167  ORF Transcript_5876/g.10167 Transcript_5876/m.10167 type:complete len:98 (-) Transcript_5876:155-448(-)
MAVLNKQQEQDGQFSPRGLATQCIQFSLYFSNPYLIPTIIKKRIKSHTILLIIFVFVFFANNNTPSSSFSLTFFTMASFIGAFTIIFNTNNISFCCS